MIMLISRFIKMIQNFLAIFNFRIVKLDYYLNLAKEINSYKNFARNELLKISLENQGIQNLVLSSNSQIGQDLFVLSKLKGKKSGFFVEFGACDGISFSNSYLLEKNFKWDGILVEPGKNWHLDLRKNRSCIIDYRCVNSDSNRFVQFSETTIPELSTIEEFEKQDEHQRLIIDRYQVKTVSLIDLLKDNNAPKVIDYLSIDTEGSEFSILNNFDFEQYQFRIITCEHNFTENRDKIFELLSKNGYQRIWPEFTSFDDWYIKPDLI